MIEKMQYNNINQKQGHTYVQWLVGCLASATVLNYGLETGWMSPMMKVLQSDHSPVGSPLTDSQVSWVGTSLALAAMFGVSIYTYIADTYGRRIGVIAIAVPQALCWAIKLTATSPTMLIVARVVGGLPAGGCFNVIPMYAKEISQDNIRGAVISLGMLLQNVGLLAMYAMGSYMDYYSIAWIALTIPILICVGMVFAPESPGFLVKKGKIQEAAKTLALLRGLDVHDKTIENEIDFMKNEEDLYNNLSKVKFLTIFKNRVWRRGFVLMMLLITAQAFNGNFTLMTYAWSILSALGVTMDPDLLSMMVPVLMIVGSLMSMACVERIGRRVILASTFVMCSLAMVTMAATVLLPLCSVAPPAWLPLVAVATSAWAYAAGINPMVCIIMSEIFCFQVRAKLIGCIVTYVWFSSFVQVAVFAPVSEALGVYTMFLAFGLVNLFGAVVTLVLLPETRGKTIEEIEEVLGR